MAMDHRLDTPAFHRNGGPIAKALASHLVSATGSGSGEALEIGSGSGQHIVALASCFPWLVWRPSEPDAENRLSIAGWTRESGLRNIAPPLDLDAAADPWDLGERGAPEDGFRLILSVNVVHIAPWTLAEGLFRGAGRHLAADGLLALYGPFLWSGAHVADSNAAFDASLRARDPRWGVRDVDDLDRLAAENGLARREALALPANNHLLLFGRGAGAA